LSPEHSTTNIQVAGVDEADIVKNDGEYIYAVSGNVVFIVKAAQEDTGVISRIVCDDFAPAGIFVSGDRLAVLGSNYSMSRSMPYFWNQAVEVRTCKVVAREPTRNSIDNSKRSKFNSAFFYSCFFAEVAECMISCGGHAYILETCNCD
jgi:hypothetical protein